MARQDGVINGSATASVRQRRVWGRGKWVGCAAPVGKRQQLSKKQGSAGMKRGVDAADLRMNRMQRDREEAVSVRCWQERSGG